MQQLQLTADRLKNQQRCKSTRRTYHHAWCNFNNFLIGLDTWPASYNDRLALFTTHLIEMGHPPQTIKSYVSAVKALLKEDGVEIDDKLVALTSLLKSCKYTSKPSSFCRLPIQQGMIDLIIDQMDRNFLYKKNQPYLCILFKSILVLGYYGLLHIGEITMAEGNHAISYGDVHFEENGQKILIVLRSSKMHTHSCKPQIVKINARYNADNFDSRFCPCRIARNYLKERGDSKPEVPFFIFRDRNPVKPENFQAVLKGCIRSIGLDKNLYDTHSLRIGCDHDLLKTGYSVEDNKKLGHWRSNSSHELPKLTLQISKSNKLQLQIESRCSSQTEPFATRYIGTIWLSYTISQMVPRYHLAIV